MKGDLLRDLFWGMIFLLLQITLLRHLSIFGMSVDGVLIYCLWIINRRERTSAILLCALFGFFQDAFLDLWGLNLFAKTLTAYILTFIVKATEEVRLPAIQVLGAVFLASILHNLIFLGVAFFSESHAVHAVFLRILLGDSLYTAIVAVLIHIFKRK